MNTDKILLFWDQHNITIIESLIGLVIVLSLFLAFRGFFSDEDKPENKSNENLEKAIQSLLEKQNGEKTSTTSEEAPTAKESISVDGSDKSNLLAEKDKKIAILEDEIASLKAQLLAVPASSGDPLDQDQIEKLQKKIQELEGRLSDYEIISEDLADISRLKKENAELRAELEALKRENSVAPAVQAPAPDSVAAANPQDDIDAILRENGLEPEPLAAHEEPAASEEEPSEELLAKLADQNLEVTGEAPAAANAPAEGAAKKDEAYVDDEFMAEFQEAVLAQKNLDKDSDDLGKDPTLGAADVPVKDIDENEIAMLNQFGEFTEKKKS